MKTTECQAARLGNMQGLGWGSDRQPHFKKMCSVATESPSPPVSRGETAFSGSFVEGQDQEPGRVMKDRGDIVEEEDEPSG